MTMATTVQQPTKADDPSICDKRFASSPRSWRASWSENGPTWRACTTSGGAKHPVSHHRRPWIIGQRRNLCEVRLRSARRSASRSRGALAPHPLRIGPRLKHSLVLAISQSGESPDILAVVTDAKKQGSPTLAITNSPNSTLAKTADEVILLHAGESRASPATKTFTASIGGIALSPPRGLAAVTSTSTTF